MRAQKINFRTKEMAERFMDNYAAEIFSKRGYAPVRAYFNESSQAWQVTSSYVNATNEYLAELKERGVLRIPHNCTRLHQMKLVLKQLLFDIDTVALAIICSVREGSLNCGHVKRLEYLMSIARKIEGEDSHKNHVAKFQLFINSSCREPGRMELFEGYFKKKIQHFNLVGCKTYDEEKSNAKKACSRFFSLIESIKREIEYGKSDNARVLVDRAETLLNEFKGSSTLSYKRKQAERDLFFCKQAC